MKGKFNRIMFVCFVFLIAGCNSKKEEKKEEDNGEEIRAEVQQYLDNYNKKYVELYYDVSLAQWQSNTKIVKGDTLNAYNTQVASEAFATFTGSFDNLDMTKYYLEESDALLPTQIRQLNTILFTGANNPETVKEYVKERIKAETAMTEKLYGFDFKINNKPVTANEIDDILVKERDLNKRLNAWTASKEVGKTLKNGLVELRELRNKTVQSLGYPDYFTYQVSEYNITVPEMMRINRELISDIWPLYRELHTYARYELAKKYGVKEVPDLIPAHWLPNRWGQDWSSIIDVEGIDLDDVLAKKGAEWQVKQAERFYVSLGFDSLPKTFWEKSSLYPLPAEAKYKKNNHASAWHMDLNKDLRSLMSIEPNSRWYETTHHELGHIYYFQSYSTDKVPPILRTGANRAFHEAIGSMMGLAAMQKPYLENLGLIKPNTLTDETKELLKEAMNYVVFIPFAAGVMTEFEHDLYAKNLSREEFNKRWWQLTEKYQGMEPPTIRPEDYCDAASKTHIIDDAAQYYDYALSYALLFQMHNHIATDILKQNPRATNYYGNKQIGRFLKRMLEPGANCDWQALIQENTGSSLNGQAMVNYFQPLMTYLQEVNKGRKYSLPAKL